MTAEILAATEHLVLRRMTNDDAAASAAYRSDPVQARYQSWETPDPLGSTFDAAHDALKTSRTVGTVWARDPNLKIKDQAARC